MGMKISPATLEINMEVPQKTKQKTNWKKQTKNKTKKLELPHKQITSILQIYPEDVS